MQANLKRYRAAVLKAAVEGRLVPTEAELARREGRSYEPASELLAAGGTATPGCVKESTGRSACATKAKAQGTRRTGHHKFAKVAGGMGLGYI